MSDSVRPHRRQLTRLPCPWDSPGSNTGVGCHFLLQCMKVKSESEVPQSCPTLNDPMDFSLPGSSIHGICQARVLKWVSLPSPNIILYIIYLYIDGHLGYFHILAIVNSAAMNIGLHIFFELIFLFSLQKYPEI